VRPACLCPADTLQALQLAADGRLEASLSLCEKVLEQLGDDSQQAQATAAWGAEGEPSSCEVGLVHKQRMECMQQLAHWAEIQGQVGRLAVLHAESFPCCCCCCCCAVCSMRGCGVPSSLQGIPSAFVLNAVHATCREVSCKYHAGGCRAAAGLCQVVAALSAAVIHCWCVHHVAVANRPFC
jgi:hypothetical protein